MISVTGKRTEMQRDGFSGNRIAGGNGAKRSCQSGRREHTDPARQDPIVYVIDGDGPTRQRLFELVDTMNLSCATFDSAQAFLEQCEPDRAGCVVTELKLPDLSGPQLQQELRSRGASHPIIFLTAYPDLSLAVQAMRDGAVHFLEKPFRTNDLWNAILEAVELDARQREVERFRHQTQQRTQHLGKREGRILRLIGQGKASQEIAEELGVCVRTVELYRAELFKKIGVDSLRDLIELGLMLNWAEGREPAETIPEPLPC